MNPITDLEDMGLTLGITTGGKLVMEGLQQLNSEQREYALSFTREFKTVIMAELRRRTDGCPAKTDKPTRTGQEWIAAICCCKFDNCTMLGNRRPLECFWNGGMVQ